MWSPSRTRVYRVCLSSSFPFPFFSPFPLSGKKKKKKSLAVKKINIFVFSCLSVHFRSQSRTGLRMALCIKYHYSLLGSNGTATCSQWKYFVATTAHHSLKTHGSRGFHPDTQHTWKICLKSDNPLLKCWQIGQLSLQKQSLSFHHCSGEIFHALWQLTLMSFKPDHHGASEPTSTNYCLCSSDKVRPLIWRSVRQTRATSTECNGIKVVFCCCFWDILYFLF